jgi:hypothetical protein
MSLATLQGHATTRARVQIPAWGCWFADVSLDDGAVVSGRAELKIADLTLSGTVLSGGPSKGRAHYRIVGGAGGWGRTVPAKGYSNDAGVKLLTVLRDAAELVGETLGTMDNAIRVGPAFARAEAPAGRVLEQLVPEAWYVDEKGVTQLGRRTAVDFTGQAARGPFDAARGTVTLATDAIATILPGIRVDGLEAVDVCHEVEPKTGLRSTIWGALGAGTSRRLAALRRLVEQLLPNEKFRGIYEYRIVTQEGERLNLQPVRVSAKMPDLARVYVRPGIAGARADASLGSRVIVGFIDSDPARPAVLAWEDAEGAGFSPDRLDLGDGLGRVLREGDTLTLTGVQAGAGTTGVKATVTVGLGMPPVPSKVFA